MLLHCKYVQWSFALFAVKQSGGTITHPLYDKMVAPAIAFTQWSKRDPILPFNFPGVNPSGPVCVCPSSELFIPSCFTPPRCKWVAVMGYSLILTTSFYDMNSLIWRKDVDFQNFSWLQVFVYKLCMNYVYYITPWATVLYKIIVYDNLSEKCCQFSLIEKYCQFKTLTDN